jgi:hypothetical protein
VQNVVKGNKRRMDLLKEDVATKVDLLQAARAKMFQECLAEYKTALLNFYDATAAELSACAEEMSGLESYEIDVLKVEILKGINWDWGKKDIARILTHWRIKRIMGMVRCRMIRRILRFNHWANIIKLKSDFSF